MNATIDSQQREENLRLSFYIEDQEYVVDFIYKDYQNQKQIIELNQVLDMNNELSMKFDDLGILNKFFLMIQVVNIFILNWKIKRICFYMAVVILRIKVIMI